MREFQPQIGLDLRSGDDDGDIFALPSPAKIDDRRASNLLAWEEEEEEANMFCL